jgi:NAD(P)-dependent dehydrogenase (short-subunit alcohol dehydrogenase family)
MEDLAGKVALITCGANGIGASVAELFAGHGVSVGLLDTDAGGADRLCAGLIHEGARALAVEGSVADEAAVAHAVETVIQSYGRLDILTCCAAALHLMPNDRNVHTMTTELWDSVLGRQPQGRHARVQACAPSHDRRAFWEHRRARLVIRDDR